jgi:uncharacterized protein (TIGR03546 family)
MFFIKIIKSLITVLNSKVSPGEIAGGVALGAIIGLSPFVTLLSTTLFILMFFLKVNPGAVIVSMGLFALVGHFLDPIFDSLGYLVLVKAAYLTPFWTQLYNMPIVPFTRFNNTVVMGALISGLILYFPLYLISTRLVVSYREKLQPKIENMKIVKFFKLSPLFQWYERFKG